jgi:hypothetical protein
MSTSNQPNNQTPLDDRQRKWQYWQGIAWGSIPMFLFLATTAIARYATGLNNLSYAIYGLIASILAYIAVLITAIVLLSKPERRFIGYGLLTMVVVAPIVSAIGCMVVTRV